MATPKQVCKAPNEIMPFDHPVIQYPQLVSTKFDGFRMLCLCGEELLSPALKPMANVQLHTHLSNLLDYCKSKRWILDGELWSPRMTFTELSSVIRSKNKAIPLDVRYHVFDMMDEHEWESNKEMPFGYRAQTVEQNLGGFHFTSIVRQDVVNSAGDAENCFNWHIENGHEGIIMRSADAYYKHGRFTTNQDGMWKFKEFVTHDAVIIGIEEQMKLKEGVARTTNVLGHLEREHSKELYEPSGLLGAFVVRWNDCEFKVKPGKGFNNAYKQAWWQYKEQHIGKHIEFKYMSHGTKDKPRIGSLVRFRPDLD